MLIVAPTHKALCAFEDRIAKRIQVQQMTDSGMVEETENPTLQTESFTNFSLYQRTIVLEAWENSTTISKQELIGELTMLERIHATHIRKIFMRTKVLLTIESVGQAISRWFYMKSREK